MELEKVSDLLWEEVWSIWADSESHIETWRRMAKNRGFRSWAHWRAKVYARPFGCHQASWGMYQLTNPLEAIGSFWGGPFRAWVDNWYGKDRSRNFSFLADVQEIRRNVKVCSILENYPFSKPLICLKLATGRIVVIEGMHRACALAIMAKKGQAAASPLNLAIGISNKNELPVQGGIG